MIQSFGRIQASLTGNGEQTMEVDISSYQVVYRL